MDSIKEAFNKVKDDIIFLSEELSFLKETIQKNDKNLSKISHSLQNLSLQLYNLSVGTNSTDKTDTSTDKTDTSTDNVFFKPQKGYILPYSIGNEGVQTDRQTDRQTDNSKQKGYFEHAITVLNSLDTLKKNIRRKFKKLTDQEFLVFSTIYSLNEQKQKPNYKILAVKLNLTESSIRDYIRRLIEKGIPVIKNKLNNKVVTLSISSDLKKITSLSTILELRNL